MRLYPGHLTADTALWPGKVLLLVLLFPLFISSNLHAQPKIGTPRFSSSAADAPGQFQVFIQNIGQYGQTVKGAEGMGPVLYGYEGLDMPILFTAKGFIHLQRKVVKISHEEEERLEKAGVPEEEIESKKNVTDRIITMEWLHANPTPELISGKKASAYHTYGLLSGKAGGYEELIYKELYPGIDLVCSFKNDHKPGFEYSLLVHPGASLALVKLKYGGDVKSIRTDASGNLQIRSDIDAISSTIPVSYYGTAVSKNPSPAIASRYTISKQEISFSFPQGYDSTRDLVIDPFVTGTTAALGGLNAGKAKDVDFDYDGNIYVTGGGNSTVHQLAKYNASGALEWVFNGTLAVPSWSFGTYWGGWMVEKPTGNIYLGQGFNPTTGFQVIRVSTTGLYDNFITTANANFREAWKMLWSCNNGSPQILVAGGGTNSNINFGVFTPPATAIGALNVTGIPYTGSAGWAQDIVDFIIDPVSRDMYTIYGSLFGNPSLTNKIYKNTFPYSSATVAWNVPSGFTAVQEIANRPYLAGGNIDNSANIFAINGSYIYYWDGKNLKAFNKATGAGAGTPLITGNTLLMQGGIVADACNNVFVGDANGVIKVYQFDGSTFNDAPADINIPGFAGHSVYDLSYDESRKLLYASGDGFITSIDISAYCPATLYTVNVVTDCVNATATATIVPAPPAGSSISYTLYNGTTQLAVNTTGVFTGLSPNTPYTIVATINVLCSGIQATANFTITAPLIVTTQVNATCGANTGSITATGSGSTGPFTYSIDGVTFQVSGTFSGLGAGIYTITVKDANGCINRKTVTIVNTNGPQFTFTQTNATCGNNTGTVTVTASGGTPPYQYSINGGSNYQNGNFFTGLLAGTYTLMVKDANNCTNSTLVTITTSPALNLSAIPASATCGLNNGSITAFGTGGTAPLQYSINGNTFQSGNTFVNLTPGTYTVMMLDAAGCTKTVSVTVSNAPSPVVTATATTATCNNVNGTITANGNSGITPYQYSINGVTFQSANVFTGLAAGAYTVTIKDAVGCTNTVAITVPTTNGPSATAVAGISSCNANTGTITITGTGGALPYQYSINGTTFQVGNNFTGLAPGNYVAYIRDNTGCIGTIPIVVPALAGPSLTLSVTPASCIANDGVIVANSTGGTPPLQYSLDNITYVGTNIFTGLAPGIYTVFVKDANGCIKSQVALVASASGLNLNVSTIASSCNINNGVITAVATGGIAPLQYSINGVTYQAGNTFNGLAAGVYTVYVKDANGCIVTRPATITPAAAPTFTLTIVQNGTCGAANGVIRVNASGGVAPLSYSLDGGAFQPINIFLNVPAGLHNVVVKDATGCTAAAQTVTITNTGTGTPPTDVTFVVRDILGCTGEGRIKNIRGLPSGGGNNYTFSLDGGAFTTANQFRPVAAGVHTITAMNNAGCTITKLATIGVGIAATATATSTPSACGASTGTITVSGVGVNTPYHISIDNGVTWQTFAPPGPNAFTYTGLASGTYAIQIADDADFIAGPPDIPGACITTIFVAVPSSGGPVINTTQINAACNSNNGSITATGSGGTAPYTYNINGGAYIGVGQFNNLTPGVYAVTVKDATGCITGANITITGQGNPSITTVVQNTSCATNNGTVTVTVTGGTAPYQYSINGTTFQPANSFTNLAPGTYTVYASDANACLGTTTITILNVQPPRVTAFSIAASCNGNDGSVVASGTLGAAPYTFSLDGVVYQSSGSFTGLAAGFYTVYIKDARGCVATTGIAVNNSSGLSITAATSTPANCGNPSGSITITATGGTAPLQYSINGGTFQSSNIFTLLIPGTYTVAVKDANGCLVNRAVLVGNVNGPQVLSAAIVHAACGLSNGSITATASGGVGALQYSINGVTYQAGTIFNGIAAGTYTLYVKDVNNCIKTLSVTVQNLAGPTASSTASGASCGLSDGTITVTATGGTLPLSYSKDGLVFQASNVFTGLAAGAYTITVRDARGCTSVVNVTVPIIGSATVPVFNPVAPICSGSVLAPLPLVSLNMIPGTWSPALNNTTTTTYTFTPAAGQCATTATLTITVNPKPAPIIIYHN
ncbi:MAG: SprB repeat-containing protein [Bacteroidetes bacterium]|nr:SprB repeat-containing protein [Bacteroidota bacterium]